jgi:hypothetical protein
MPAEQFKISNLTEGTIYNVSTEQLPHRGRMRSFIINNFPPVNQNSKSVDYPTKVINKIPDIKIGLSGERIITG